MKSDAPSPYDAPEAVVRQASAWLTRRDRGFTRDEAAKFSAWVAADPAHVLAVAQLERTLHTFDRLRELAPEAPAIPDPDAFAPPRKVVRWKLPALTALAAAAALAIVVWRPVAPEAKAQQFATATNGYQRVTLEDGSVVDLNGGTRLEVAFSAARREVRLAQGEAHFRVARNPQRAFVVTASGVVAQAVGTAFNVRLDDAAVEVLVTEGRVKVDGPSSAAAVAPATEPPILEAGHRALVPLKPEGKPQAVTEVSKTELEETLAWHLRILEFKNTPLRDIVADFNRHGAQRIVVDDDVGEIRISGNFRVDQPDAFVRLLESSFGVHVEKAGDVTTLRKPQ